MNIYFILIFIILIGNYLLNLIVDYLNVNNLKLELPGEFQGYYDAQKYALSQSYLKENTFFEKIKDTFYLLITLVFISMGGFNYVDLLARQYNLNPIITGLIFTGFIGLGSSLIDLPFSLYHTFVIEKKYGFNRTTVLTFFLDKIKVLILTVIIGSVVLYCIYWFFYTTGSLAWFYCWLCIIFFQLFFVYITPLVIMPLFNKFIPLGEGTLKEAIQNYVKTDHFQIQGIYKMDGSKRSTKSNAFFTGFGKFKRIVLYDTLIERHTVEELVSILSHEIGHYKKRHILKNLLFSFVSMGVMLYILSLFINNKELFEAFKMEHVSIYAGIIFFSFLYTPVTFFLHIILNRFSRKYEYEADTYSIKHYQHTDAFISALKKLSTDNLTNLTPHPLKVFLEYSHPPILDRIQKIKNAVS